MWGLPGQTVGQTALGSNRAWLRPQVAGGHSRPGACLPELLPHTGPHALWAAQVFSRSSQGAAHTRQVATSALEQHHTQQSAAATNQRAALRTSRAPGVSGLDSEEDQRKTAPPVPQKGVQKGQEGGEKHSVGDPGGRHFTCLPTLSPSKKQMRQAAEHKVRAA